MELDKVTQVVIQATPFCNMRCKYCYLPDRGNRAKMPTEMPKDIIKYLIQSGIAAPKMEIRWHAGEPLAAGLNFYREAIDQMEEALEEGYEIRHTLQTNATYVNAKWCEFFKEKDFTVGVSIDGPKMIHDRNRLFANQKGTYDATLKGLIALRDSGVKFNAIAVISSYSLDYPEELYAFFSSLKIPYVGLNVEETEGINSSSTINDASFDDRYRSFFQKVYELHENGDVIIREAESIEGFIRSHMEEVKCTMTEPMMIFNVDHQGNFSTFSPELLGMKDPKWGDFSLGNIYKDSIESVVKSKKFQALYGEIQEGVSMCRKSCEYFSLCGGGAPSNKLYENGSFASTETAYCRARFKIPTDVILTSIEQQQLV